MTKTTQADLGVMLQEPEKSHGVVIVRLPQLLASGRRGLRPTPAPFVFGQKVGGDGPVVVGVGLIVADGHGVAQALEGAHVGRFEPAARQLPVLGVEVGGFGERQQVGRVASHAKPKVVGLHFVVSRAHSTYSYQCWRCIFPGDVGRPGGD